MIKRKKLTEEQLKKAINFIIEYDVESLYNDGSRGIYNLFYYGCPAYKDFTNWDIYSFLDDNEDLTLDDLIK